MVKFYRGLYSGYNYDKATNTGKHLDCIYFATDVGKILMNGIEFSSSTVDTSKFDAAIKGVTISNNVLTFIPVEGSSFTVTIPTATSTTNGIMSSADKSKLDSIESGAQKNTITGVKGDSESTYRTGNVNITKTNIGLGNVDNTSDENKPISTAQQTALDKKVDKVSGKGLSTNDYTTEDKNKLSGIAAGATANEGTITGIKMNGVSKGTSGIVDLGTVITSHQDISGKLNVSLKGTANGLAELDSNGKVPSSQLPSYVDDVLEYSSKSVFPTTGESGKIYIDTTTNLSYRWGGTAYVEISPSLALGETSSTAYRGDRGKIAYDHSQSTHARTDATKVEKSSTNGNIKINGTETTVYTHPSGTNPHGTTKSDVGLGNVGNFKAVSTVASQGLTDTEKANARVNIGAGTSSFSGSYNDLSNKPNIPTVGNGTITITQNGATKGTFTTNQNGNTTIALTDTDTNTTYSAGTGISLSGTTFSNSGVRSIASGSSNGTISVNTNGTTANVAVRGLGSAAYTASSAYAAASHTHTASSVTGLATVATSGNYNDLSNKPTQLPANGGTSANSNWLNVNSTLSYGASGLNYFNQSTSTTSGATVNANPTNDWYHILRMNHANGQGYFVDLAFCFHSDIAAFRRIAAGTEVGWKTFIHSGNIGSQSVASATKATQDSAGQQINTTYIKGLSVSGRTITYTKGNGTTGTITTQDTNTTYSASNGISLSGTTFSNSGVRSVATGSTNGTITVNTNGTSAQVAVRGLGSAAYTNSSTYATANHTHTGAQVTMGGYSTLSGGYVTTSDTVNSAVHKIEDQLLWYELN